MIGVYSAEILCLSILAATMLQAKSTPRPSLCATRTVALLVAIFALMAIGCSSSRSVASDSTTAQPADDSWTDATVGERLGRLDVRMRTAPADSLPLLQEEYRRLLAERSGQPAIAFTGGESMGQADAGTLRVSPPGQEVNEPVIAQRPVAEPRRTTPLMLADEPPLKGFRSSEINPDRAARAARKSTRAPRASAPRVQRPKVAARATPRMAPSTRSAAVINDRAVREKLVTGITAARSGNYEHAVRNLAPVIAAGKGGQDARFYYATALERTGDLSSALREYLRASKMGGSLGDKAYLGHLRVMAALGDRDRARDLLNNFVRENPDSGQIVQARRMLQTL